MAGHEANFTFTFTFYVEFSYRCCIALYNLCYSTSVPLHLFREKTDKSDILKLYALS